MEIVLGDITTLEVDAIVNAANQSLTPGGGVCGAIHAAAGPELAHACIPLAPCPTGRARITPGYDLPAPFVIHAVGPVWRGGDNGEQGELAFAYQDSLSLAAHFGLKSIAFPAISTGIYGFPPGEAAKIAVHTIHSWMFEAFPMRVVLVAFDEDSQIHLNLAKAALEGNCET